MSKTTGWIIIILIISGVVLTVSLSRKKSPDSPATPAVQNNNSVTSSIASPIDQADTRITKKPFGIYITPQTSPIQPEKFTGFHTGTDFEIFASEATLDVPFYAICAGQILQKRTATGYGGILVESCTINNQAVTIVYGHIKLSSIAKTVGDSLQAGEKIGFLGQPPTETDGERKHLHLGIHIGTAINILGYVQKQSDLPNWLDWQKF